MSFKENCSIYRIDVGWGLQKLGLILWKKVSPNLKLAKHVNNKRFSFSQYIFQNYEIIIDIKNLL